MAVTEAAHESSLVAHLEDVLDVGKLERALSHVIVGIERVIDVRHLACMSVHC